MLKRCTRQNNWVCIFFPSRLSMEALAAGTSNVTLVPLLNGAEERRKKRRLRHDGPTPPSRPPPLLLLRISTARREQTKGSAQKETLGEMERSSTRAATDKFQYGRARMEWTASSACRKQSGEKNTERRSERQSCERSQYNAQGIDHVVFLAASPVAIGKQLSFHFSSLPFF